MKCSKCGEELIKFIESEIFKLNQEKNRLILRKEELGIKLLENESFIAGMKEAYNLLCCTNEDGFKNEMS